ncbi:DEAD/DEAH box helicase family protein [archaeon]|jgi:type I restriction enzyme, R subunit|nr:DEAD/DEAH box helicase family protein [archaeon]
MNESETRAELIDPKLKESGWGVIEGTKVLREYNITAGRIQTGGRAKPLIADYILTYKGVKLAVVEAKRAGLRSTEGVGQAKNYAEKLHIDTTFATNGKEIYQICMNTGKEGVVDKYPTPEELWKKAYPELSTWKDKFSEIPNGGIFTNRFYQEIAIKKVLDAVADGKQRMLLTLATGTGKTVIAFQIAWKLFQARWNLSKSKRQPRILFLADRNILADQAYNSFSSFPEDALVRINPNEIKKRGKVPTNGNIFFTIFQTFMTGKDNTPNFGQYPKDYFDLIIVDECHRGGANDESNWRGILDYFSPAVQLGLTATPKRKDNSDTYKYFGEPLYTYSLKEGINDGFLTPFKVKRIKTTMDDYIYTSDDKVIEGEVEEGKVYEEADFNRIIEIKAREAKRVQVFMDEINQKEKTIVFCATQDHALAVRDLINQSKESKEPNYCVRVTANDGALGEMYLREFQDNEKSIPTILTTSQKLSTGVDARNIRNIILMRPVNSMIEFKQIIGRGTRLFDNKYYFTVYDFIGAYHHFLDPEWDGEPEEPVEKEDQKSKKENISLKTEIEEKEKKVRLVIKLSDGKKREIQHMTSTSFWSAEGKPMSAEEFLKQMFGVLPSFFKDENDLRTIWSNPKTRIELLDKLDDAGYGKDQLNEIKKLINAEKSDVFDVLEYISFAMKPLTREERVAKAQLKIYAELNNNQKDFMEFILTKYIESGVRELDQEKLPKLLNLKYDAITNAKKELGTLKEIKTTFIEFQKHLYQELSN